jgi:cholesterol oxidase
VRDYLFAPSLGCTGIFRVNMPITGHLIGGATIGDSPDTGVVDPYHRLFGHAGLHVVDGSTVSVNLAVNPSLTITAQAERARAVWPNRGEVEPAPGALRLPVIS